MEDVSRGAAAGPGLGQRLAAWALPIGLYAAITIQSCLVVRVPDISVPFVDKLVHAAIYGILGALVARALRHGTARPPSAMMTVAFVVVAASCLGALDEIHQSFVPGRSPDVLDGVADAVGAALGSAAYVSFSRRRREASR